MGLFKSESEKAFKAQAARKTYLEKTRAKKVAKIEKFQAKGKQVKVDSLNYEIKGIDDEIAMMDGDMWVETWMQTQRDKKQAARDKAAAERQARRNSRW